jgi:hypothetical protein
MLKIKPFLKQLKKKSKVLKYYLGGKKPWSPGYIEAREDIILQALNNPFWKMTDIPKGFGQGFDERVVEIPWLYKSLDSCSRRLWDVGSVLNHDYLLLQKKIRNKQVIISNLNPEAKNFNKYNISYLYENAVKTSLREKTFSEIICISTLEHVGFDNSRYDGSSQRKNRPEYYLKLINVFHKMLAPSGKVFITVPFGQRADHGWYQTFDEIMITRVLQAFEPVRSILYVYQCKHTGWELCKVSKCNSWKVPSIRLMLEKNLKNSGSEAVACLEMQK